jgi:glutamate-5-semialdehyde dehydrogenase
MTTKPTPSAADLTVPEQARRARQAALRLANLTDDQRRRALLACADALERRAADILAANALDCDAARADIEAGRLSPALFKRLQTSERGVADMAAHIRGVAALPDPLNRELAVTALDDGLTLSKVSCPLGVFAVIFEARPEVLPQIASLALRSGNAVLLKGGSEAQHTNTVLESAWREGLAAVPEVSIESVTLLHTREDVNELLKLDDLIDLVVPRGSNAFVRYIMAHSRIPVLGHGEGLCHVYLDRAADPAKAVSITLDSKLQYPAACNAVETLLVHAEAAPRLLPEIVAKLLAAGVEVRGCPRTLAILADQKFAPSAGQRLTAATDEDWATEYTDLILSVRVVDSLDAAIAHINRFGSRHTDAIVTEDAAAAAEFLARVDSAGVYHNASTRFSDGFRYGFGAELGIATGKTHARGPVGLEGLTTYKYLLRGHGHTVASYASGERKFTHRKLR